MATKQDIERDIFKHAADFEHPVLGVHITDRDECFIFDQIQQDGQTPAHAVRYMLPKDWRALTPGDVIRFRAPDENDPAPDEEATDQK